MYVTSDSIDIIIYYHHSHVEAIFWNVTDTFIRFLLVLYIAFLILQTSPSFITLFLPNSPIN